MVHLSRGQPKTKKFNTWLRTFTTTLFVAFNSLTLSAHAEGLRAAAELAAAKAFTDQQAIVSALQTEKKINDQIKLIKQLDNGFVISPTNPLKQHHTAEAIEKLQALMETANAEDKLKVQKTLYEILSRSVLKQDREKAAMMLAEQPLLSAGQLLPPGVNPSSLNDKQISDLKQRLELGSSAAGFILADFFDKTNAADAKIYRAQGLYQAAIDAQTGADAAIFLATLYIDGRAGAKDAQAAMNAIELAVDNGSDAALSLMDSHFDDPLFVDQKPQMKALIEKAIVSGSDQAAEMLILDQIEVKRYGFTLEEALWALSLLDEIKSSRSYYVSSKLYAEGKLVPRDIRKAEGFLSKFADVAAYTNDYQIIIGKRILNIDMPQIYQYKYALPIFLRLTETGKGGAINRVAGLINEALRDAYFESTNELPIHVDKLIAELTKSYNLGDLTSGLILGDIYRQGLAVPQNLDVATKFYQEVLAKSADRSLALKADEALAKILRRGNSTGDGRIVYQNKLRSLAERGNLWAKKEYGSLLLDGTSETSDNAEKGIALMFEDINVGYYSANSRLLRYAIENKREDLQQRLIATFEKILAEHPSPAVNFELANIYSALGRTDDAFKLLAKPDFDDDPEAILLRMRIGIETNKITRQAALPELRRVMALTKGTNLLRFKYAKFILSEVQKDGSVDADALDVVSHFADTGDIDAIKIGLRYMMQDISNHQERLARVVAWVAKEAQDGRPDMLLTIADEQLNKTNSPESNALLAKALLDNLDRIGERSSTKVLLARIYTNGFGVAKDLEKAKAYRRQAAVLGNQSALFDIGTSYLYGAGQQRDLQKAEILIEAAATLGSNNARISEGRLKGSGFGSQFSQLLSFANSQQAAEEGSLAGMIETGRAYLAGAGVEQDTQAGLAWLEKAAAKKSPFAASQLYFYYIIQDRSVNNQKARYWLDRAIEYGNIPSLVRKAVLLHVQDPVGNDVEVQALLDRSIAAGQNLTKRYKVNIAKENLKK